MYTYYVHFTGLYLHADFNMISMCYVFYSNMYLFYLHCVCTFNVSMFFQKLRDSYFNQLLYVYIN